MHFHRLRHARPSLFQGATRRNATRQIRRIGPIAVGKLLEKDRESIHEMSACFILDFIVSGGISSDSWPATVTFPGLSG